MSFPPWWTNHVLLRKKEGLVYPPVFKHGLQENPPCIDGFPSYIPPPSSGIAQPATGSMIQRHHHSANGMVRPFAFREWRKMTQKGCCPYQICQPCTLHEAESCSVQDHLIWPYCLLQMTVQHWSSSHGLQPKYTQRPKKPTSIQRVMETTKKAQEV